MEAAEEAVEGGGGRLVCRVRRRGRVHADRGVARGRLCPSDPGTVRVAVRPGT